MTGLSPRNQKTMRAFVAAQPGVRIVQRTDALLSIGVAECGTKLVARQPADLEASLPTIKKIVAQLASEESLSSSDNGGA